ncbi:MAG: hypothetical protein JSS65_09040 [Armatimonadetes bacterium]|nr:hypothetical protein [Armatimonadota bacterium]
MLEAEAAALDRIERASGRHVADHWPDWSLDCARPLEALHRLERWLGQLSSPGLLLDYWIATPVLARLVMALLGASHHLADLVAQNPETGAILSEPEQLRRPRTVAELQEEARRLLAHSVNYSHSLDRLRFLKQRETLRLAAMDLARLVEPQVVWMGISDLAEAVISILREVVWEHYLASHGRQGKCPFSIVAFGKFGGRELNFSSDIDLVFVLEPDLSEEETRHAYRACELMRSAVADKMGRGDLYRVDLRLRPYGSQGPIACPMEVYRSYYRKYAETWEHLALLRSRVVAGEATVAEDWEELRKEVVFGSVRSDMALEGLIHMRGRIEELGSANDLKRGPGGIRDVEFLTQTIQMVFGKGDPAVQVRQTTSALAALCQKGLLDAAACQTLTDAYIFLRQTEHRCQIVGNLQTHDVPTDSDALAALSHAMGHADSTGFLAELARHRKDVRRLYEALIPGGGPRVSHAKQIPALRQWLDPLPGAEALWASLAENRDSIDRVVRIAEAAPALAPMLANSPAVTEAVLSGEVLEDPVSLHFEWLSGAMPNQRATRAATDAWLRRTLRWCLGVGPSLGQALSERDDAVLRCMVEGRGLTLVALGSAASRDTTIGSDVDLVLLCSDDADWAVAERSAQDLLASVNALHASGDPLTVDVRLRPEGRKGSLVVTETGFSKYEAGPMELWERFALGRSRLVSGQLQLFDLVKQAAYGRYIGREDFTVLAHMKRRIENERVNLKERTRHLKLGLGALDDIQWAIQLLLLSRPEAGMASGSADTAKRIDALVLSGAITSDDADILRSSHTFLNRLRAHVALMGYPADVLPENPDRLAKLATEMGLVDGNELLREFAHRTSQTRLVFEKTIALLAD